MKIDTILQITKDYQYAMARNSKEAVCLFISKSVRIGDIKALSELIESTDIAKEAIQTYQQMMQRQPKQMEYIV